MTMRFPKWLLEEPFDVAYNPTGERGYDEHFRVMIWDKRGGYFLGFGMSISAAAKNADHARQRKNRTMEIKP